MAECRITEVYTGIAGSHIRSLNSSGMVAIKEKEVTQADIDRVVETAKAIAIPNDQQILHILPQEFIIDGQEDVREPLGMSGVRLEVKVHIVTGAVSAVENITKCVRRCGLVVKDVILQPLASSIAVLERRREGARRLPDGHRRRHDRPRGVRGRRDPAHGGDPDRGRPDHERHRDDAAHADEGGRGAEAAARLRVAAARRSERHHRGARRRRPAAAQALAADAGRSDRAARRGALHAGPGGAAALRLRGAALVRASC